MVNIADKTTLNKYNQQRDQQLDTQAVNTRQMQAYHRSLVKCSHHRQR